MKLIGYTLYDRVEDPITIDVEEDEGHIYVTAIERLSRRAGTECIAVNGPGGT